MDEVGPPPKASLNRDGGVHGPEPLVFSRQNISLGTLAPVNKNRHQSESKLLVSATGLHLQYFLLLAPGRQAVGQPWTELPSLCPEGAPTLKTICVSGRGIFSFPSIACP